MGVLVFYAASLVSSLWLQGRNMPDGQLPWFLVLLAIATVCTLGARRWPDVGLGAGALILALVLVVWLTGGADPWIEVPSWRDWGTALSQGAGNLFVPTLGIVLTCLSLVERRRR